MRPFSSMPDARSFNALGRAIPSRRSDMDATHRELSPPPMLLAASDAEFPEMFSRLREHTRAHFEHEGKLMKTCRFPASGEHNSEHLRVLGELAHFARGVAVGRLGMARNYVRSLPDWFHHPIRGPWIRVGCLS